MRELIPKLTTRPRPTVTVDCGSLLPLFLIVACCDEKPRLRAFHSHFIIWWPAGWLTDGGSRLPQSTSPLSRRKHFATPDLTRDIRPTFTLTLTSGHLAGGLPV